MKTHMSPSIFCVLSQAWTCAKARELLPPGESIHTCCSLDSSKSEMKKKAIMHVDHNNDLDLLGVELVYAQVWMMYILCIECKCFDFICRGQIKDMKKHFGPFNHV